MENILKRLTVLVTLMNFMFVSMPLNAQIAPSQVSSVSVSLPDINEATFYKLIDEETQKVLEKLAPALLQEEAQGLLKIKQKVIKILKGLNFWAHAKHLFIQHGIGVAITSAISEVVTVVVLPPMFIGMGWNLAALVVGGTPSPLYMVPAYLAVVKLKDKHKLAGEMGYSLSHVMKLDRLRRDLLGFAIENRVMDVMIQGMEADVNITIIKRKFSRFKSALEGNLIDLSEIENLVKESIGNHKVGLIKEYAHGDDAVYASLLMQEINRDGKMKMDFHDLMHTRINSSELPFERTLHENFFKLHDELNGITRYRAKMREFKGATIKILKENSIDSKLNKEIIGDYTNNMLADLDIIDHEIKVFEYRYLNSIRDGQPLSADTFEIERQRILGQFETVRSNIDLRLESFSKASQLDELTPLLDRVRRANEQFRFQQGALASDETCGGILRRLFAKAI